METYIPKNIEIQGKVLILPMRNGNNVYSRKCRYIYSVLILPMRNGNRQFDPNTAEFEECSYPTYEEWKLNCHSYNLSRVSMSLSYL